MGAGGGREQQRAVGDRLLDGVEQFDPIQDMVGAGCGALLVQITVPTPGATIRYTLDDTDPTLDSSLYTGPIEISEPTRVRARAFAGDWNPSRETVASFLGGSAFAPSSVQGLSLWVRSDGGIVDGPVTTWRDQSGHGNDLTQPAMMSRPRVTFDSGSRMPLLGFDGNNDWLGFTSHLTGIRTVFWVTRRSAHMTNGWRYLLGDTSGYPFCSGADLQLWSSVYTDLRIRSGETRLNGLLVDGTATTRPTDLSVISVVTTANMSADRFSGEANGTYSWWGDLGELVIYDRALSPEERRAVEEYLAGRYGIGLSE